MIYPENATAGQPVPGQNALYDDISFDSILDETCERLLDRQVKYAIQRIHEMEHRLDNLERELDEFLSANKKQRAK
jgi:hypothetical protein